MRDIGSFREMSNLQCGISLLCKNRLINLHTTEQKNWQKDEQHCKATVSIRQGWNSVNLTPIAYSLHSATYTLL